MTLAESFVEPFDDLSQWHYFNSTEGASVDSNQMVFTHPADGVLTSIQVTNDPELTIDGSWFSFRMVTPGPSQGGRTANTFFDMIHFATFAIYQIQFIHDIDDDFVQIHDSGSDFSINYPGDAQPYFCVAQSAGNLVFYASLDGVTWDTLATVPTIFPDGETSMAFYTFTGGDGWPADIELRYDSINQFSPFGAPAPPTSTYLRHSSRHAHQTLVDYVKNQLGTLDWTNAGNVPFGAPVVTVNSDFPDEWDESSVLEPGTVIVTLGDEHATVEEELGPLASISLPFFIDCFMDTDSVALALSLDIRDVLCGRLSGSSVYQIVKNYNEDIPADSAYQMEFEDVVRDRVRPKWHVVKVTAVMYFNDLVGG